MLKSLRFIKTITNDSGLINPARTLAYMEKFIGYARTSTGRQFLGLEEQEYRIRQFIESRDGKFIEIIVEQESGKNNQRVGLERALTLCEKHGYTLLFTKLDRLSREVEFLFALRNRGVKLTCI